MKILFLSHCFLFWFSLMLIIHIKNMRLAEIFGISWLIIYFQIDINTLKKETSSLEFHELSRISSVWIIKGINTKQHNYPTVEDY